MTDSERPRIHSPEGQEMLQRMDEIADRLYEETDLDPSIDDALGIYRKWLDQQPHDAERWGTWPTEWAMDSDTVSEFIQYHNEEDKE